MLYTAQSLTAYLDFDVAVRRVLPASIRNYIDQNLLVLGDITPEFSIAHVCILVTNLDLYIFMPIKELNYPSYTFCRLFNFENGQVLLLGSRVNL